MASCRSLSEIGGDTREELTKLLEAEAALSTNVDNPSRTSSSERLPAVARAHHQA